MLGLVSSAREAGVGVGHAPAGWQVEHRHCPAAPKFRLTQRIRDLKLLLTAVLHGPDPPIENMTPGASPSHPATPCRHRAVLGSRTEKAPCLHQASPRGMVRGPGHMLRFHEQHRTPGTSHTGAVRGFTTQPPAARGTRGGRGCPRPRLEQETKAAPTAPVLLPGLAGGTEGLRGPGLPGKEPGLAESSSQTLSHQGWEAWGPEKPRDLTRGQSCGDPGRTAGTSHNALAVLGPCRQNVSNAIIL